MTVRHRIAERFLQAGGNRLHLRGRGLPGFQLPLRGQKGRPPARNVHQADAFPERPPRGFRPGAGDHDEAGGRAQSGRPQGGGVHH